MIAMNYSAIRLNRRPRVTRVSAAFTLLELLIALTLLTTAMTIIVSTFMATLNAWRRGQDLLEGLHQGDFVMDQLVSALRSAAFFNTAPDKYGFYLDSRGGGRYPQDTVSWVATGTAFLPEDSPLARGLHRLEISIDRSAREEGFAVRAVPHLIPLEDATEEPWIISTEIKGVSCRVWDKEREDWSDEWEFTNSVPRLVELTLYLEPFEQYGDPVKLVRVVEIPLGSHEDMGAKTYETAARRPGEDRQAPGGGRRTPAELPVANTDERARMQRPTLRQ